MMGCGTRQPPTGAGQRNAPLRFLEIELRTPLSRIRAGAAPFRPRLIHSSPVCVHFSDLIKQRVTMSDITIPGGRIRSFVERVEQLDAELQELSGSKKEVFSEAKAAGFDVKILKEINKRQKQDKDERDERYSLLDLYMRGMEGSEAEPKAKAA